MTNTTLTGGVRCAYAAVISRKLRVMMIGLRRVNVDLLAKTKIVAWFSSHLHKDLTLQAEKSPATA